MRLLGGLFFGPLVAILIGVEAGTTDSSNGVFRDLVVTGRSRLALFATRVPAALALCWAVIIAGYALILLGTFVFASNLPTPSGSLVLEGFGFLLLATGVLCTVAVGFASLIDSKPGAIIALIAWQVIASPLISSISSLGSGRDFVLSQAIAHFGPAGIKGARGTEVVMSGGTAVIVIVIWLGGLPRARRLAHAHDGRLSRPARRELCHARRASPGSAAGLRPCGAQAPSSRRPGG